LETSIETNRDNKIAKVSSFVGALIASSSAPWRAKTVLVALIVVVLGGWFWVRDAMKNEPAAAPQGSTTSMRPETQTHGWDFSRPVPAPVRIGASYIGGFLIGWAFRRVLHVILALAGAALLIVGAGKFAGCNTVPTETKVKQTSALVQHEATIARDYLKTVLPTASAGAVGTFLGFRRRIRQGG
jgi:uncharacterized membrane protein (Fun14 family)